MALGVYNNLEKGPRLLPDGISIAGDLLNVAMEWLIGNRLDLLCG
jgi:hypothetical protein